jgi:glycosyltransferase involved in cell wall biosynthesis
MPKYSGDGSYANLVFLSNTFETYCSVKTSLQDEDDQFLGSLILPPFNKILKSLPSKKGSAISKGIILLLQKNILNSYYKKNIRHLTTDSNFVFHYLNPSITPIRLKNDIVTIHDTFTLDLKKEHKKANITDVYVNVTLKNLKTFKKFERIVVPSLSTKKRLVWHGFEEKNLTVIHHAADPSFYPIIDKSHLRKSLGLPEDKKLILSVSSLDPRKGIDLIAEVNRKLPNDFKLVRVGKPIGDSINFINIKTNTLNKIYNACDLFLFPTRDEGFGIPIIEAFATLLPVVSSDIEVMKEVTRGAAVTCELDATSLMRGIRDAIENREILINKMKAVNPYYRIERFSNEMNTYYTTHSY